MGLGGTWVRYPGQWQSLVKRWAKARKPDQEVIVIDDEPGEALQPFDVDVDVRECPTCDKVVFSSERRSAEQALNCHRVRLHAHRSWVQDYLLGPGCRSSREC